MPIEMRFVFFFFFDKREEEETQKKKKKIIARKKKRFFSTTTHRHFDASGRLPADFHVEEHDWVGHDDDDFLRVRFSKKKCEKFETTELSRFPFFLSKKERKSAIV